MAQFWTKEARPRTFLIPLAVALPTFFFLGCLAQGLFLIMSLQNGWDNGRGNMALELQAARKWVWFFAALGGVCGVCWAWIILVPLWNLQRQLNDIADRGADRRLSVDHRSELSFVALAFNRALEEVEKSLPKKARTILGSVTSGVVVLDSTGEVEWMNPYAARLFHAESGRTEGRHYREALSRSADLVALLNQSFQEQSDFPRRSITLTDRYGETRRLSAWTAWIQGEEGETVGMVLTVVDDTRLESFSSGIEGAETASSLRHVASGIVHEIRNPLTPIRGLAQILASGKEIPPEKLSSYSQVIIGAVDRVNQVVDRFALLTKPPDEAYAVTSIGEVAETVNEAVAHLATKAKVSLHIDLEDPGLHIPCQPKLLARALTNLVINGIEASPARGVVKLTSARSEDRLLLEVENFGSSIPASELEDLFLPFHTTKKNGTGLGIPISDSIVKSHGGSLSVKSGGNRTVFTVSLPLSGPERREAESDVVTRWKNLEATGVPVTG